ncbi:MAG: hypothetical protein KDA62_19610, partial [Planctomycetales bacterium]|nr:hypothetical protein [Planctomycetales bacterium]
VGISSEADGQATVVGHALGTPAYMAPEQASGRTKEINSRTDVYGLGAILFEILAGSAPHRGPTTDAILQAIQHRETPTTRDRLPTVPKPLDAICAKAMAKKGCDRYGNALELARDIQHWLDDEPISVCPETLLRRASRWQRRHRSVVALVLMFAMLVGSCIGWLTVASRQRLRAQLEAWQVEVVTNRDQARVDLLEQNFDQGLTKCDDTLLNLKFQPEYLQRVAARSNETEGVLSRQLLDALSELVFLKGRAELMLASTPSEEDERRAAAKQAFEVADAWSSAPAASRLFRNAFLDRKLSAHQILSRDDTDVPATALDHLLVGEVAQFAGDRERAIRHYEDALESEPTHFWAHLLIGIARFEQGESITALESFNQAARLKPEVAWIYAGRALILADLARWDAAHADLDLAESLLAQTESPDPSHYVVPNNRSVVLYTQARTDGSASMEDRKRWLTSAIAQSERASELNDAFENAYNNSGMAAVEMARLLRSENPEDAEIELYLNRASDAFGVARTRGSNKVRPSVNRALMSIEFSDGQESELQRARRDLEDARLYAESLDGVELRSATRLIVYGHAFADGIVAEQRIKA